MAGELYVVAADAEALLAALVGNMEPEKAERVKAQLRAAKADPRNRIPLRDLRSVHKYGGGTL